MASTKQGIYYQDDYSLVADVPNDMKKMAESVDTELEKDRTRLTKNESYIKNIQEKDSAQDTNIETLTQRLTEKDNQIAELEDKVSDLNNNQICGKASGEYVHLVDSAKMNCEIAVCGNSKQETRKGYNLLKNTATTQTIYGVTFTVNEDGTVTVNGTSTDHTVYMINNNVSLLAGEYTISGCPGDGTNKYRINFWKRDWSDICTEIGNGKQITLSEDIENAKVGITIYKGVTVNNLVFKPMIVAGTQNKEYEPYGAMPSLEFESPIESVEGSANVKVWNKNIFDKDNANILNASIGSSISAGNYGIISFASTARTLYIKCKSDTVYSISRKAGTRFIVGSTTEIPKKGEVCSKIIIDNTATNITYATEENDKYLLVYYYLSTSDTLTEQEILDSIQIEEGTATDYIAHEEQNYTIDIQEEMLEGDYFDLENGKEVHNWQKIESYNGEEITTEYKSTTGELSTGATVYYKLAEPRKLDLTENQTQQLQALAKAKTYKNITNITTDTIAVLDVDYKKDLETIINNMQALILAE